MSQAAKAQEPSMEEILASIRRIIADDDGKPAKAAEPPAAKAVPAPPPPSPQPAINTQEDVDAMLADLEPSAAPPAPPAAAKPEPEPEPPPAAPDVLMLTEEMTAQSAPQQPPGFRTIEAGSDVVFSETAGARPAADAEHAPHEETANDRLLSNATALAVDNAFNSLAHTILGNNARTLEDLVKEMLRPMLKGWLDDNLPGMVERIVRAEIERVSRGR